MRHEFFDLMANPGNTKVAKYLPVERMRKNFTTAHNDLWVNVCGKNRIALKTGFVEMADD
jgi:hypothetical protein